MMATTREILNTIHQALIEHQYVAEDNDKETAITTDAIEFVRRQLQVYELLAMKDYYPVFGNIIDSEITTVDYTEVETKLYTTFVSQKSRISSLLKERLLKELYDGQENPSV